MKKKLVEIPTTLRLEVPADMKLSDVERLVEELTIGDFAVYPDSSSGSLKSETKNHLLVNADKSLDTLANQISEVDLWASENKYKITEL